MYWLYWLLLIFGSFFLRIFSRSPRNIFKVWFYCKVILKVYNALCYYDCFPLLYTLQCLYFGLLFLWKMLKWCLKGFRENEKYTGLLLGTALGSSKNGISFKGEPWFNTISCFSMKKVIDGKQNNFKNASCVLDELSSKMLL